MSDLFNILRVCDEANSTKPLTTGEVFTALRIAIAAGMGEFATQLLSTFAELETADVEMRERAVALIFSQATANPGIHKTH